MRAVVGQADVGKFGQYNQVVGDDSRFAQFGDAVQLAPAQHLMTQLHIIVLGFAVVPAGQAGTHKHFAVEGVGDAIIELFLAHRRMWREVDHRLLNASLSLPFVLRHFDLDSRPGDYLSGFNAVLPSA